MYVAKGRNIIKKVAYKRTSVARMSHRRGSTAPQPEALGHLKVEEAGRVV